MNILKRIVFILAFGLLLSPLFGQKGNLFKGEMEVEQFHTQGMSSDGKIAWELNGESADLRGKVVELSLFTGRIVQDEERAVQLKSTSCRFLQTLKEVKSDAPLELTAPGIFATGIGYDIYFEQKIVRIRSTVNIVLQRHVIEETRKKYKESREQSAKEDVKQ